MPKRVLVAHDTETIREALVRLVAEAGYDVVAVSDGRACVRALRDDDPPDALVVDAALSGVFSYEVLEHVRERKLPTRTILIASIYNRAGYKRRPTSLYGADDYVEQHHIPDLLLQKLAKLLGTALPDGQIVDHAVLRDAEPIREAGEARLRLRYGTRAEGLERARRLARLIAADIALYNPDLHLIAGDPEREARLREDLEEGRLLFDLRVPHDLRDGQDFLGEAMAEIVAARGAGAAAAAGGEQMSAPTGAGVGAKTEGRP